MPHATPHPSSVPRLPDPFWLLQGTTAKELACSVTETPSHVWIITLKLGHETMLRETHPDQTTAVRRATDLKDGLIDKGWTQVRGGPQFI